MPSNGEDGSSPVALAPAENEANPSIGVWELLTDADMRRGVAVTLGFFFVLLVARVLDTLTGLALYPCQVQCYFNRCVPTRYARHAWTDDHARITGSWNQRGHVLLNRYPLWQHAWQCSPPRLSHHRVQRRHDFPSDRPESLLIFPPASQPFYAEPSVFGPYKVERLGRKALLLLSSSCMALASIALAYGLNHHQSSISATAVFAFVGSFAFGLGEMLAISWRLSCLYAISLTHIPLLRSCAFHPHRRARAS